LEAFLIGGGGEWGGGGGLGGDWEEEGEGEEEAHGGAGGVISNQYSVIRMIEQGGVESGEWRVGSGEWGVGSGDEEEEARGEGAA